MDICGGHRQQRTRLPLVPPRGTPDEKRTANAIQAHRNFSVPVSSHPPGRSSLRASPTTPTSHHRMRRSGVRAESRQRVWLVEGHRNVPSYSRVSVV
ncbi:hypothetical protein L226DRAFT_174962 [Lentinus tigrinus ALCF2SS1-7]|uniref:uncharacterized protein n=1 Tax=Lentinus tigrinus ALCF2SS1-7 TaxID=1328758 RepID=UPI001165D8D1|nr:hypothetical protein L226DRAFT_174962 [Lentinus tigrinus ALCF2SS1-7]